MFEDIFAFRLEALVWISSFLCPFMLTCGFNTYDNDNELAAHICVELAEKVMWRAGFGISWS